MQIMVSRATLWNNSSYLVDQINSTASVRMRPKNNNNNGGVLTTSSHRRRCRFLTFLVLVAGLLLLFNNQKQFAQLLRAEASAVNRHPHQELQTTPVQPRPTEPEVEVVHEENIPPRPFDNNSSLWIPSAPDPSIRDKVLAAIEGVVPFNQGRFVRCPVTCQVRIDRPSSYGRWILRSIGPDGQFKTVGGDEYYVTFTDNNADVDESTNITHATAIARAWDQEDGTYELDFVASPMLPETTVLSGKGRLTVHMEYTCGVGNMGQPMKDKWHFGAASHETFHLDDLSAPPSRLFVRPPKDPAANLAQFETVYVLGDSVMNNFVAKGWGNFGKSNLLKFDSPASALNSKTVDVWIQRFRTDFGTRAREQHQRNNNATSSKVAFLTASSTWDILNNEVDQWMVWKDHLDACRKLIETVRYEFPWVTVLWKSATAIHVCNPNIEEMAKTDHYWGVERVRYMSESRSYDLDQLQKQLMKELKAPVLDVYDATYLAADYAISPTDARHYDYNFNQKMLNWFYF